MGAFREHGLGCPIPCAVVVWPAVVHARKIPVIVHKFRQLSFGKIDWIREGLDYRSVDFPEKAP